MDWNPAYGDGSAHRIHESPTFPNNGMSHELDKNNKFHFQYKGDFDSFWNRIKFTVEAWDERPGLDVKLYQRKFHTTESC